MLNSVTVDALGKLIVSWPPGLRPPQVGAKKKPNTLRAPVVVSRKQKQPYAQEKLLDWLHRA